ncbi:Neuronal PAS domain-containing protein 3 [Camelus dromedarius]|uniref:Neuronal PAS domain-containing protein 3 n=1 Tax=Camelus dromedarius TaxID=9838 RepID=A0A5N4E120_CAMDR|nr:Neuronal PAS domain-containing protein 3 [Camelus dromedarius]
MRDFANQGDPPWNLRMEGPPPNTSVKVVATKVEESHVSMVCPSFDDMIILLTFRILAF